MNLNRLPDLLVPLLRMLRHRSSFITIRSTTCIIINISHHPTTSIIRRDRPERNNLGTDRVALACTKRITISFLVNQTRDLRRSCQMASITITTCTVNKHRIRMADHPDLVSVNISNRPRMACHPIHSIKAIRPIIIISSTQAIAITHQT